MAKDETSTHAVTSPTDAVLVAARAFVGIVARSLAEADTQLTPPQLRVLMIIATRGPMNLSDLSEVMGVHPSNATRAADRLVNSDLLHRQESPADRRRTVLSLSAAGGALVEAIIGRRRVGFEEVLGRMSERDRRALGTALAAFAAAAGEPDEPDRPGWEWVQ
jgi:DNA-binding MarR family transcriptional regulator